VLMGTPTQPIEHRSAYSKIDETSVSFLTNRGQNIFHHACTAGSSSSSSCAAEAVDCLCRFLTLLGMPPLLLLLWSDRSILDTATS
jgi:hypothetical protein